MQLVSQSNASSIVGTVHAVKSRSAHDGKDLNLHLWQKRRSDLSDADVAASGKVVLLVHGSRRSGRVGFDLPVPLEPGEFPYSLMDAFANASYDVYSLDIQNYGRSDHHPSGLAVTSEVAAADIAAAVEQIRSRLKIKTLLLFGWSWGGTTTALYAEANPDIVRKLVIVGPRVSRLDVSEGGPVAVSLDQDFCVNAKEMSAATLQPEFASDKVIEAWINEGVRWDPQSPNGVAADFQRRMPLSNPAKLTMPTLLAYGAHDFQLRNIKPIGEYFTAIAAKDKQFLILPDAGHAIHLHRSRERFAQNVLAFLEA